MSERKLVNLGDFSGGEQPDSLFVSPPAWYKLKNVWFDSRKVLRARPSALAQFGTFASIQGIGKTHNNKLLIVADNFVYEDTIPISHLGDNSQITSWVSYDVSRTQTCVTAGDWVCVFNDPENVKVLNLSDVKSIATFQGMQKLRLCFITSGDPYTLKISNIGDLEDTGTQIIDSNNYNDEWTEGIEIYNFPFKIIDLIEYNNNILIFTAYAIYVCSFRVTEDGFIPIVDKVIDIEILDAKVKRLGGVVFFLTPQGIWQYFTQQGQSVVEPLANVGIEKQFREKIVEGEARINLDILRGLIFLKPNNTDGITYVYSASTKAWSEWDILIRDAQTIEGTTYIVTADDRIYYLEENDITQTKEVVIQSGLIDFGDSSLRKRLLHLKGRFHSQSDTSLYITAFADEIPPNIFSHHTYWVDRGSTLFEQYIGVEGERISVYLAFNTKGNWYLEELIGDIRYKSPRIGKVYIQDS